MERAAKGYRRCKRCHKIFPASEVSTSGQCRPCGKRRLIRSFCERGKAAQAKYQQWVDAMNASLEKRGFTPVK